VFAPSDSAPVSVTLSPQASKVVVGFVTFTNAGVVSAISTSAQSVPYGSNYTLRVDVENAAGTPCQNVGTGTVAFICPTGKITLLDNGSALNDFPNAQATNATNVANLNDRGFIEDQPIQLSVGTHPITATYTAAATSSYTSQASSNTLSVTITAGDNDHRCNLQRSQHRVGRDCDVDCRGEHEQQFCRGTERNGAIPERQHEPWNRRRDVQVNRGNKHDFRVFALQH